MPRQWNSSFERLKPNAEKLRSWMTDAKKSVSGTIDQWLPTFDSSVLATLRSLEQEWNFSKIQEILTEIQDSTRLKIGEEVYTKSIALGRHLIKAQLHEVKISDGTICYWKTNNSNPETILFIHGFGDSKDGCYPLAMALTRHYNMMAFDLPGFGASFQDEHLPYTFESYGQWMIEFLDAVATGPVHVIGNSLGGAMAMKVAELRPDLVKSLTLIDTAAISDPEVESAYDNFIAGDNLFQVRTREEFERFWKTIFFREPLLPIFLKEYIFEQFRQNSDLYGRFITQTFEGVSSRKDPKLQKLFMDKALKSMKMPVHIIWGEKDRLFPLAFGEKAHKLAKGSRFTVLKNVGHAPQVESPLLTAKHIKRFLEEYNGEIFAHTTKMNPSPAAQ